MGKSTINHHFQWADQLRKGLGLVGKVQTTEAMPGYFLALPGFVDPTVAIALFRAQEV
jgi:hypothetical protein